MFNARACRAAICHAMLPKPRHKTLHLGASDECFRYVSHAIPIMASRFFEMGLQPHEIEVKMFGGGNVIDLGGAPHSQQEIGRANILMAREIITGLHLHLKAEQVGGNSGCKIIFNTQTGQVLHKRLREQDRAT
jgi:chemotaxis protein CheD